MGMLLTRYHNNNNNNMAAGATEKKVAPMPTPEVKKKVTRQDIMKMNASTVRAYAETQGIKDVSEKSGAELKRILVDMMFEE